MKPEITSVPRIEDHWVMHPGGRLFCRTWSPALRQNSPSASPVVLFHDSLGCVDLWRDFPTNLAAASGRRVIAYDRLGFGRSDARGTRPSLDFVHEEAARYFPHLRAQLGIDRFVGLGHSAGGGMAIHCAALFPADCEALVTEAAQVFAEDKTLSSIAEARAQFEAPDQLARLAKYHGIKAKWVVDAWTECWLDPAFAAWGLLDVLPRVTCPVLALQGEDDEYGSVRHPKAIEQRVSGPSDIRILARTGHVPHREHEAEVIRLIAEFLTPRMRAHRVGRHDSTTAILSK